MDDETHNDDIDKENLHGLLADFYKECETALKLGHNIKVGGDFDSIVFCGMGGSCMPGDMLQTYLGDFKLPFHLVRNYDLPKFVTKKSLVFCNSYSGNTEETISAFKQAVERGCTIIGISSGGKLMDLCRKEKVQHVKVPEGIPPRMSIGNSFFIILTILQNNGIIERIDREIRHTIDALKKPEYEKMGMDLAEKLYGKIPIIYASERFKAIAMRWKTDINENAKIHAFYNYFPEFNHNEINGYVNKVGDFYVIIIKDESDHVRIKRRMQVTKELIKQRGVPVTEMEIKGDNLLTKIFSALYVGTWMSYFLALKYETDPSPVKIIEDLKKMLR